MWSYLSCTRQIRALVVEYLQEKGYGVNLLRIDKSNSYSCEECYEIANEANEIVKTTNIELYAVKVSNALAGALNLLNRGVKKSLIVLNETVMSAILVECLFADSSDADVYNA